MAASDMMSALMELCQEKHIDQLYLIDRLEQSLAKSYAEILHLEWGAKVTIDRTTGKIYVYRLEPIDDSMDEEGNFTEFEEIDVTPKNTSRIAAQHAKAEINAIVRNSAREQIYEEFSGRIGDLISGTVLQSTPDFTIVKIREGVEAELPDSYVQQPAEKLRLYRELDTARNEEMLKSFEAKLIDRFGPLPRPAAELLNVVRLRWEAVRLGMERVKVKNGLMIVHFVGDDDSPYYKSDTFMELLRKVTQRPDRFVLKQHNNRLAMTVRGIKDVAAGYEVLKSL